MTGNDYINQNKTETFKAGDKVVILTGKMEYEPFFINL